jgi:hypothetical protein
MNEARHARRPRALAASMTAIRALPATIAIAMCGCAMLGQPRGEPPFERDYMTQFEWRRAHAPGAARYVANDVFLAHQDAPLVDVLRAHILGFCRARDARVPESAGCLIGVYVNGLWAPTALDDLRPRDIGGAEYFEAVAVPPQYRRGGQLMPVLVLWLKPR